GSDQQGAVRRADRGRQGAGSGQVAVDASGGRAALGDGPDDQRLAAAGVTGDEDAIDIGGEVRVTGDVTALVQLDAELGDQAVGDVGAGEAHGEGDQLGGDLPLGAGLLGQPAVDELDLDEVEELDVAVLVALEVGGGDGVDPLAALLVR